jgi:hypothetical protein
MSDKYDQQLFGGQAKHNERNDAGKPESLLTCLDGKPEWAGSGPGGGGGSDEGGGVAAFDNHAIFYISIGALFVTMCMAQDGIRLDQIAACTFGFSMLGCFGYYTLKAIFITTGTYITWKEAHPGESIWDQDGGLTSYDQNFADAIGRASAGKGNQSQSSKSGLTGYDHAMADEIGRKMRKE